MVLFIIPNFSRADTEITLKKLVSAADRYKIVCKLPYESRDKVNFKAEDFLEAVTNDNAPQSVIDEINESDIIVSIGGDGTMMHASVLSAKYKKPLWGINAGHLGFLTQTEKDYVETDVKKLVDGKYTHQLRRGLKVISDDLEEARTEFVLNDVVITKTPENNIVKFSVYSNDVLVNSFPADGLILSTATGSTAYNLSAGGVVIDPLLKVISVVPLCPHSVTAKPIIFGEDHELTVIVTNAPALVVVDGHKKGVVPACRKVKVGISDYYADFICFGDKEFFEVYSEKLKSR